MSDWLSRGLSWLIRKIGTETLFFFSLLLLILWTILNSLGQIVRAFNPGLMALTGVTSLLCGWLLARSRLRTGRALPAGLLIGTGWVFWQVGHLRPLAWEALQAANRYFLSWLAWRPGIEAPPYADLLAALAGLWSGIAVLSGRALDWAISAIRGGAAFDPLAASLVWGLAIWLVSGWAAWAIRRWRKPLWAVAPSACLVGLSLASVGGPTFSFLILLASTLAMLGWNSYRLEETRWLRLQIDFSEDLRLDIALAVIAIIMCLTSIAAMSPAFSLQKLVDWTDRVSSAFGPRHRPGGAVSSGGGQNTGPSSTYEPGLTFGESLGLSPPSPAPKPNALDELRASGGLPQEHLLGSGPELSEQIVLEIRDENEASTPPEPPSGEPTSSRFYWRAVTYDRYSGVGWATGPTKAIDYPADERALAGGLTAQTVVRQDIRIVGPAFGGGSILFSPGDLLAASQDYQIAWRHLPAAPQDGVDQYGALARPVDRPPRSYRIEALVSQASQEQLRAAGSLYSDWILENDLLLPDSLPDRVRRLALDLTATRPNPYDRALAIEAYLRNNYPYTLDLDEPPGDRDLVDYFLFDLKQGYCDYYASAMVVLARASGIPARLAVGYVGGTYDPENRVYRVSGAEAHSWPELYFPGYGWIGFEPTAGRPALERSQHATSLEPPQWSGARANFIWRVDWLRLGFILMGLVGLATLGWLIWSAGETWWLRRLPVRLALIEIYRRLIRSGKRLQIETFPGDTPRELAQKLSLAIEKPSTDPSLTGQQIDRLVAAYSLLIYSQQPPDDAIKHLAVREWRLVRRRLWLIRLKQLIARFRRIIRS